VKNVLGSSPIVRSWLHHAKNEGPGRGLLRQPSSFKYLTPGSDT
jgi:hypothetical protein